MKLQSIFTLIVVQYTIDTDTRQLESFRVKEVEIFLSFRRCLLTPHWVDVYEHILRTESNNSQKRLR